MAADAGGHGGPLPGLGGGSDGDAGRTIGGAGPQLRAADSGGDLWARVAIPGGGPDECVCGTGPAIRCTACAGHCGGSMRSAEGHTTSDALPAPCHSPWTRTSVAGVRGPAGPGRHGAVGGFAPASGVAAATRRGIGAQPACNRARRMGIAGIPCRRGRGSGDEVVGSTRLRRPRAPSG